MKNKKNLLVIGIVSILILSIIILILNIKNDKEVDTKESSTTTLFQNKEVDNKNNDNVKEYSTTIKENKTEDNKIKEKTTEKDDSGDKKNSHNQEVDNVIKQENTTEKTTTKKVVENKNTTTSSSKNNSKYTYEWSKEKDAVGKQYLYIVDKNGNKVEGTITISYNGSDYSETKKVTTSGILLIKDIVTISNIKVK